MNKQTLLKIAKHCQDLANRKIKPQRNWHGLCREINLKFETSFSNFICPSHYPDGSGDTQYPVKSPFCHIDENDYMSAKTCFDYYEDNLLNMWDARTKYGKARLHFTKWISEQLFELAEMY